MPSRQNAARIDPAVWESYRTEIHTHYLREDKSLNNLISYMREEHGFNATKAQYERQFVLWKFRKNLTSDEWGFAIDRMEKRKRDGKENALFVDGFRVPAKKILKEISRGRRPNNTAASEHVQTPEGISVRTPQALAAFNISLENLPWIRFQNHIESQVSASHVSSPGNTSRRRPPSLPQPSSPTQETEMLSTSSTSIPTPLRPASGLSGAMAGQNLVVNIPSIFQLPSTILESQGGMTLHGSLSHHSLPPAVKFALYLASNNLLSDRHAEKFLRSVIESKQESVLASLFKENMPTIEALARFTFKHALYIQNTNILRICLQAGADPNLPLKAANGSWSTPLELSMYVYGNIELAKVLLDAVAHTNDLSSLNWDRFSRTALAAITALFNIELAQHLLELSADIGATDCWGGAALTAAAMRNVEPIRTLFRAGVSAQGITKLGEFALVDAARDHNTELVQILLESGVDINALPYSPDMSARTALDVAIANSYIDLVQILLDAGANVNALPYKNRDTALQSAAEEGNIELVRTLLDAGADVNTPAGLSKGKTALQAAALAEQNGIELVQILLHAGANVNAPPGDTGGYTALQAAVWRGDIELVQVLLHAGANVNASPSCDGYTALQAAAERRVDIELVQILLHAGADVNAPPAYQGGITALQAAVNGRDIGVVRILLEAGANVDASPLCEDRRGTALQTAAELGDVELVRILLDAGADANAPPIDDYCPNVLQTAAGKGNIEVVQILLHAGADVNAQPAYYYGYTALQAAARKKNIEVVRILLGAGANVDALPPPSPYSDRGGTALQTAAEVGDVALVRILLDAGANVNAPCSLEPGWTALQAAVLAEKGNIELVQILLDAGADANAPPVRYGKRTTLQHAVAGGDIELVRALLDAGADVNAPPGSGTTALHEAVAGNRIELVRLLLDRGADVSARHRSGKTALQEAVTRNRIELVQLLLGAGADVNAPPIGMDCWTKKSEGTALQAAVGANNTELVRFLLGAGADINAPAAAFYGRTALQAAALRGSTEMVQLLLDENADVNAPAAHAGGITALQGAAIRGHLAIAILLLQAGADVTAAPAAFSGRNALEGAAENGRLDMVQLLLDACTDLENPGGGYFSKAAILAERGKHHVVAKLVRDYSR